MFGDSVQSVLIDDPDALKLRGKDRVRRGAAKVNPKRSNRTRLLLRLLKPGEGHKQVLVYVFLPKELHGSLVHLPAEGDVAVPLLKACILDPVLHLRVDDDEWTGVKETRKQMNQFLRLKPKTLLRKSTTGRKTTAELRMTGVFN